MDRAAKLWGSRKSWLQVNGSTGGLLAAIRAATRRGGPGPGGPALPQGHLPRHRGLRAGAHLPPAPGGGGAGHRRLPDPGAGGPGPGGPPRGEAGGLPQPHLRRGGQRHGGDLPSGPRQGGPGAGGRGPRGPPGLPPRLPPQRHGPGGGPGGGQPPQDPAQPHPDRRPPCQRQAGAPAPGGPADGDLPVQLPLLSADGLHGRLPGPAGGSGGGPLRRLGPPAGGL